MCWCWAVLAPSGRIPTRFAKKNNKKKEKKQSSDEKGLILAQNRIKEATFSSKLTYGGVIYGGLKGTRRK